MMVREAQPQTFTRYLCKCLHGSCADRGSWRTNFNQLSKFLSLCWLQGHLGWRANFRQVWKFKGKHPRICCLARDSQSEPFFPGKVVQAWFLFHWPEWWASSPTVNGSGWVSGCLWKSDCQMRIHGAHPCVCVCAHMFTRWWNSLLLGSPKDLGKLSLSVLSYFWGWK